MPRARLFLLCCLGWLAACAAPTPPAALHESPSPGTVAYVASNGWHSGIVLPRDAVAATGLIPEIADFPDARWLVFGWGDRDYYRAGSATVAMALGAALLPTPSVMHVDGRGRPPAEAYPDADVVGLALTAEGEQALIRAISAQFDRPADGGPAVQVPGEGAGRFYAAQGRFHLGNTCNTWTARMLRAAGVDIDPGGVVTAGDLMGRLRR